MKFKRDTSWWYWLATAVLMVGAVVGCEHSLMAAIGLGIVQMVHFAIRTRRISFPVQVRMAFLGMLLLSTLPQMQFLHVVLLGGLTANVAFRYCLLARNMSLLPWNRSEAMSMDLLKRTYLSKPVYGTVQHGLGDMFITAYPHVNLAQRPKSYANQIATTLIGKHDHATASVAA